MTRLLQRLRILDENGDVSWTSVYLGVGAYCMARGVQVSWAEVAAFVAALAGYHAKKRLLARVEEAQVDNDPSQREARVAAVERAVATVADELKAFRSGQTWAAAVKR